MSSDKPKGQGWGNGEAVEEFNARRRTSPTNTYTAFRPRIDNEAQYMVIREWLKRPDIRKSFSALINSLLPRIKIACEQTTEIDEQGKISIEMNFGRVTIE